MLVLHDVNKAFASQPVLQNLSISFEFGLCYLLLGENGAGKSTLFKCIAGDEPIHTGSITLNGESNVADLTALQYQFFDSYAFLKVQEVISLFTKLIDQPAYVAELYEVLDIAKFANTLIKNCSGGQRKALSLYLAFLLNKPIVLLDEPFADLDLKKKKQLIAYLRANHTLHWLKRTNILPATYFIGMGFGVFLLMNVALILMLIGYALFISISWKAIISITVICNFVLLAMYPLCFIIAGIVKNGKTAQSLLTPIMLIFMFSITMPSMFLTLNDKQPQDYYSFLAWNPMLYLTDTLQVQLQLHSETWLPIYQYVIILSVVCACLTIIAKKLYR